VRTKFLELVVEVLLTFPLQCFGGSCPFSEKAFNCPGLRTCRQGWTGSSNETCRMFRRNLAEDIALKDLSAREGRTITREEAPK
jgi:hypothetical protein